VAEIVLQGPRVPPIIGELEATQALMGHLDYTDT
jgi:hypothetical protein